MVVKSGQIIGNFPSISDRFCVFITFVFNITYLTLNLYNLMSIMAMFYTPGTQNSRKRTYWLLQWVRASSNTAVWTRRPRRVLPSPRICI